ncbi:Transcriptional regulator of nonfermentable carbon utilization, partial [Coemansia nantahalensis]
MLNQQPLGQHQDVLHRSSAQAAGPEALAQAHIGATNSIGGHRAGSSSNSDAGAKRKRPKAVRACNHCQKTHLTCDDSRPCARCKARGLEDSCVDGVRKTAKYLIDAAGLANVPLLATPHPQPPAHQSMPPPASLGHSVFSQPAVFPHQTLPPTPMLSQPAVLSPVQALSSLPAFSQGLGSGVLVTSPVDPRPVHATPSIADFGSEAVNLEYSIMASMLSYALDNNGPGLVSAAPGAQADGGIGAPVATITIPSAMWA